VCGQTTDSSAGQAQEAQSVSGSAPSSDQVSEDQQPSSEPAICGVTHLGQCLKDIGHDQAGIWTSPLRIQPRDAFWLVPFAAGTGVALHYDAQAQQNLGVDKSRIDASNIVSGFGSPYATLGGAAGIYFLGLGTHNEHLAETGRLGAEAVINSLLVVEALKLATNRDLIPLYNKWFVSRLPTGEKLGVAISPQLEESFKVLDEGQGAAN